MIRVNGKDVEPRSITLRESKRLGDYEDLNCALVAFCCDLPYEEVEGWLLDQPLGLALEIVVACQEVSGYGDQKSGSAGNDSGSERA